MNGFEDYFDRDTFAPAPRHDDRPVVRQAQVTHTLTETTGSPVYRAPRARPADDAHPGARQLAATAVAVTRAALLVTLYAAAAVVVLLVLMRIVGWLA
jgi:hypothetical protein